MTNHGLISFADLDTNNDGKVDANDNDFDSLRVVLSDGTTKTLEELGIESLSVESTETNIEDENGNTQLAIGSFTKTDGTVLMKKTA